MGLFDGNCNNQQYLKCYAILVSMRITSVDRALALNLGVDDFQGILVKVSNT